MRTSIPSQSRVTLGDGGQAGAGSPCRAEGDVAVEPDRVGGRNPMLGVVRGAVALALLTLALPAAAQAPQSTPWPERLYNPQPAPDDLILPMPCGGAMAFRRIEVPHEKTLSDRKIVIGGSEERFAFAEAS